MVNVTIPIVITSFTHNFIEVNLPLHTVKIAFLQCYINPYTKWSLHVIKIFIMVILPVW